MLLRAAAAAAARALRASHSASSSLPVSSFAVNPKTSLRGTLNIASRPRFSCSSASMPRSSFAFRRTHLDFPRKESLLRRAFLGRGGSSGPDAVLAGLIGANVAVYGLWQVYPDPHFLRRHFVVSASALADGRIHTLVTSAFSHREGATHLLVNMVSLYFFGRGVGRALGGRFLLNLYLASGVGGSVAHAAASVWPCYSDGNLPERYKKACVRSAPGALGASAAVNGVVALSCLLWPSSTVLLWGIVPVPAALLGAAFVFQDLLGAWRDVDGRRGGGGVAHAGHLGGAAVGAAAWLALRRRGVARW